MGEIASVKFRARYSVKLARARDKILREQSDLAQPVRFKFSYDLLTLKFYLASHLKFTPLIAVYPASQTLSSRAFKFARSLQFTSA